jgi:hypothetical protein
MCVAALASAKAGMQSVSVRTATPPRLHLFLLCLRRRRRHFVIRCFVMPQHSPISSRPLRSSLPTPDVQAIVSVTTSPRVVQPRSTRTETSATSWFSPSSLVASSDRSKRPFATRQPQGLALGPPRARRLIRQTTRSARILAHAPATPSRPALPLIGRRRASAT